MLPEMIRALDGQEAKFENKICVSIFRTIESCPPKKKNTNLLVIKMCHSYDSCVEINVTQLDRHVRMAERSKALRSGRSLVLQAWVRIPLLTDPLQMSNN